VKWITDAYGAFMLHRFLRWIVYAYIAIFALIFFSRPDVQHNIVANAHRLSCHLSEFAFGADSSWGNVNCEARFYNLGL
jgi:hypothetical protein